eukprot:14322422-Alexandrium_andersonii.AAC.1
MGQQCSLDTRSRTAGRATGGRALFSMLKAGASGQSYASWVQTSSTLRARRSNLGSGHDRHIPSTIRALRPG